ncbi:MAG: peptidase [Desulfuromonadales bacterium GWD2_61_12]|nr:MAG: peptidase [Desulfuromonadales bacterium GWD2_61_12]
MRTYRSVLTAVLVTCLFLNLPPQESVAASLPDLVTLAKELKPAVVNISTSKTNRPRRPAPSLPRSPQDEFFDDFFNRFFQGQPQPPLKERSLGSGFIISRDGYILTNDHVVNDADEIKVKLADGRSFTATIKGRDAKLDLALLKIENKIDLPVARLGDSDTLEVGEWVMAIGNPFGLAQTVTAGIVSAKGRVIGAGPYDDFIQTDASINPGNSGGPLFNLAGEVIGINSAIIAGGQGIGFAIPINTAKNIVPQLKDAGHVTRGWLGVNIQLVSDELAASFALKEVKGALVSAVEKGSPADQAGIRRGDIILSFDRHEISHFTDLPRLVAATPVGRQVVASLFRDGKTVEVKIIVAQLAEGPKSEASKGEFREKLGMTLADSDSEAARRHGLQPGPGVIVISVDGDGPAAAANLRPGDRILEAGGETVTDAAAFLTLIHRQEKATVLRLLIERGENIFYTTLALD